jgi:hypothetical protein
LDAIMSERRRLINLAYRMLGSLAEAEDVVQETYARWYAMSRQQQDAIASPGAWLTTVASRICLNLLRSARARRETYVGEWIPEPLPERAEWMSERSDVATVDPADRVTLDESVNMAFLVVLESMTPAGWRSSCTMPDTARRRTPAAAASWPHRPADWRVAGPAIRPPSRRHRQVHGMEAKDIDVDRPSSLTPRHRPTAAAPQAFSAPHRWRATRRFEIANRAQQ